MSLFTQYFNVRPSRLISEIPQRGTAEKIKKWIMWAGLSLVAILFLCLFLVAIKQQWWPARGIGLLLYWMHDEVYLTIKGNLWTRFYPTSAIVLSGTLISSLFILFGRPVFDFAQYKVLDLMMTSTLGRTLIYWWNDYLAQYTSLDLAEVVGMSRLRLDFHTVSYKQKMGTAEYSELARRLYAISKLMSAICAGKNRLMSRPCKIRLLYEALICLVWLRKVRHIGIPTHLIKATCGDVNVIIQGSNSKTKLKNIWSHYCLLSDIGLLIAATLEDISDKKHRSLYQVIENVRQRTEFLERAAERIWSKTQNEIRVAGAIDTKEIHDICNESITLACLIAIHLSMLTSSPLIASRMLSTIDGVLLSNGLFYRPQTKLIDPLTDDLVASIEELNFLIMPRLITEETRQASEFGNGNDQTLSKQDISWLEHIRTLGAQFAAQD